MSKVTFKTEAMDIPYQVEAEILPSGACVFTFDNPLPGRTKVISVDADVVEDVVRTLSVGSEYDLENDAMMVTLSWVRPEHFAPTEDEPGYMTAVQVVPAAVVLEMVLDRLTTACDDCGTFDFGEDILPGQEPPSGGSSTPPPASPGKTYLN